MANPPLPNIRRGAPATPAAPANDGSWTAKYDGTCAYCEAPIDQGETKVRWNDDDTAVVCARHK